MKTSKNKFLATALILAIVFTMFAASQIGQSQATSVYNSNFCVVEGVLTTDSYTLYPYAQTSLDIGFSKYGELIGYNETTGIGVGLQYPGYDVVGTHDQHSGTSADPFANEVVNVNLWLNGWFIDIKYPQVSGDWREIWAFAMFSDGSLHGGDWISMPEVVSTNPTRPVWQEFPPYANPDSNKYSAPKPTYGGRKTNGVCVTDPITIIYNGPRKFIALTKTRVMDGSVNLVDITFTLIFNKDEKNLIVLKDIKNLYDKPYLNIAFGNRGEWDFLPSSYVHFYTDEPVTSWDVNNDTNISPIDEGQDFFYKYMVDNKHPKKWWNDVPTSEWPKYLVGVPFSSCPEYKTWFEGQNTVYDTEWHTDQTIHDGRYAVAQVINKGGTYVGAVAVWPHPEFWSVQNWYPNPYPVGPTTIALMLTPLSRLIDWYRWTFETDPNQGGIGDIPDRANIWVKLDDMPSVSQHEPSTPFIIYEHDFRLGVKEAYRIAAVYMLTDYHNADDADAKKWTNNEAWSSGLNVIDREIKYQLDEIFNPWDINDAMHKDTKSWVQYFDHDIGNYLWDGKNYYQLQLPYEKMTEQGLWVPCLPVYRGGAWDQYCVDSERVLVNTGSGYVLIYPNDKVLYPSTGLDYNNYDPVPSVHSPYYTINLTTGKISFYKYDTTAKTYVNWCLPTGSIVEVLWSSEDSATTAAQWTAEDPLYPLDGTHYIFPLHHDITSEYRDDTEVFVVEELPFRLNTTSSAYPFYTWSKTKPHHTVTVNNVGCGTEVEVKYFTNTTAPGYNNTWQEQKFLKNVTGTSQQTFSLTYNASYVEKVWIHSEKPLTTGGYVFSDKTSTLYLEQPLPIGQWLFVNYTYKGKPYEDWFYGSGYDAWDRNTFTLRNYTDVGSLHVYNTVIIEEIIYPYGTNASCYGLYPYGNWTKAGDIWKPNTHVYTKRPGGKIGPPPGVKCPVPDEATKSSAYTPKAWISYGFTATGKAYQECEWINITHELLRGNYIIQETPTCDQLVLDQPINGTKDPLLIRDLIDGMYLGYNFTELKIVFKVPSGRWEWATVGKIGASVDSVGLAMVTAAYKNKLIEIGLGGLDIQDTTNGPRIPWLIEGTSDTLGRYSLYEDWCYSRTQDLNGMAKSWPISSSNVITVGGTAINKLAQYSNDWTQGVVVTTKPAIYPVTCWNTTMHTLGGYVGGDVNARYGYAVISTYKDKNGTTVLLIHGWTGQDTYFACKWFDEYKYWLQHINIGITDLILKIDYKYSDGTLRCPPTVSIIEHLGTISEKPQHDC